MSSRDWEDTFREWSKPSSDTEHAKCENAERLIGEAIRESSVLSTRSIEVFAHGSYRNNTNVRHDSDVDICVRCMDVFFCDFSMADGFGPEDVGLRDSDYTYAEFKNDVEAALVSKFGRRGVTRGNKAFDVHGNTYRVDADVVACFEHRRYTSRTRAGYEYLSGTEFKPDRGGRTFNWPHQNYANGVIKNRGTGNRYKYITRILKRLRNEMSASGIVAAEVPSYLIECLVWNVPDEGFGHKRYTDDVAYVLAYTLDATEADDKCREWGEVNELKYLFWRGQTWTRSQANAFLASAWHYVGLA